MADGPPEPNRTPPSSATQGGFAKNVLPALLWALAIFIGGGPGVPQHTVEGFAIPIDKVDHLLAFCAMQVLCFRALRYELPSRTRRHLLWLAALLSVVFGVLLEIYQLGLPDRSAEVADAVADALGAVLGALVCGWLRWP